MSFLNQIRDTVLEAKDSLEQSLAENKAQAKVKLDICKQCENFNNTTKICGICHCFMPAKTRLPGQHCPIDKW